MFTPTFSAATVQATGEVTKLAWVELAIAVFLETSVPELGVVGEAKKMVSAPVPGLVKLAI